MLSIPAIGIIKTPKTDAPKTAPKVAAVVKTDKKGTATVEKQGQGSQTATVGVEKPDSDKKPAGEVQNAKGVKLGKGNDKTIVGENLGKKGTTTQVDGGNGGEDTLIVKPGVQVQASENGRRLKASKNGVLTLTTPEKGEGDNKTGGGQVKASNYETVQVRTKDGVNTYEWDQETRQYIQTVKKDTSGPGAPTVTRYADSIRRLGADPNQEGPTSVDLRKKNKSHLVLGSNLKPGSTVNIRANADGETIAFLPRGSFKDNGRQLSDLEGVNIERNKDRGTTTITIPAKNAGEGDKPITYVFEGGIPEIRVLDNDGRQRVFKPQQEGDDYEEGAIVGNSTKRNVYEARVNGNKVNLDQADRNPIGEESSKPERGLLDRQIVEGGEVTNASEALDVTVHGTNLGGTLRGSRHNDSYTFHGLNLSTVTLDDNTVGRVSLENPGEYTASKDAATGNIRLFDAATGSTLIITKRSLGDAEIAEGASAEEVLAAINS